MKVLKDKWKILLSFLAAHISLMLLVGLIRRLILQPLAPHLPEILLNILSKMLIPAGLVTPLVYLIFMRPFEPQRIPPKQKPSFSCLLKCFILQCGAGLSALAVNLLTLLISGDFCKAADKSAAQGLDPFILFLLLLFNPIFEEWLSRKLVLERLLVLGEKTAVFYSSFLFAFMHLFSQGPSAMLYTFLVSLLWARLTLQSGKLIYAIILHALMNFYSYVIPQLLGDNDRGNMIYLLLSALLMPLLAVIILIRERRKRRLKIY